MNKRDEFEVVRETVGALAVADAKVLVLTANAEQDKRIYNRVRGSLKRSASKNAYWIENLDTGGKAWFVSQHGASRGLSVDLIIATCDAPHSLILAAKPCEA